MTITVVKQIHDTDMDTDTDTDTGPENKYHVLELSISNMTRYFPYQFPLDIQSVYKFNTGRHTVRIYLTSVLIGGMASRRLHILTGRTHAPSTVRIPLER